jgi:hypothetical protein
MVDYTQANNELAAECESDAGGPTDLKQNGANYVPTLQWDCKEPGGHICFDRPRDLVRQDRNLHASGYMIVVF